MYHSIFKSILVSAIVCISHLCYAQNLPVDIPKYLEIIEQEISNSAEKNHAFKLDEVTQYKQNLRQIQKKSQETILKLQEDKKVQQQLLDTLGPAPDASKGEKEAEKVKNTRSDLENKRVEIDGKIKNAQLDIARSENLINELASLDQEKLQLKLSERLPSPFLPQALIKASEQALIFVQNMYNNPMFIGLLIGVLLLNLLSIPILNFLNYRRQQFSRITFLSIGHRLVIQLIVASSIIMTLRYGNFAADAYENLISLSQAIAAIILAVSLFELLNKIKFLNTTNVNAAGYVHPFWKEVLKKIQWISLIFIPTAAIGFTEFSAYFIFNIFTILLAVFFFSFMRAFAIRGLALFYKVTKAHAETKTYQDVAVSGSTILIIEPVIAILTSLFALFFWGYDYYEIKIWAQKYANGITIGKFTLNFQDIWAALISFIIIYSLFKVIRWFLASRVFPKTSLDVGIVNTVLTILGYVGITLAVVSATAALGFDASNLALVAGALSVGIGFGLQAIFSNFVSGLILLFERPFKVGDWVQVGAFEGIIRRISVRATEIETFHRSSVIVPNAQMISDVVTNRTLHDTITRIEIPVGVAYGSDIEKVKELLMECAIECEKILKKPNPYVIFTNFGDSALDFELRFWIASVHSSLGTSSDVRFLIDKKFREHQIEIPFPQRDLHIRSGLAKQDI